MIDYWHEWMIGLMALAGANAGCYLIIKWYMSRFSVSPEEMAAIKKKWKAQKRALSK